jgi:iron complex transport system ATP-binding protein
VTDAPSSPATSEILPVRLRGVSVRYDHRVALHEVDLTVSPGEFVVLAGPNGSGKTTLLRVILGFLPVAEGVAELFGSRLDDLAVRERARLVAWVPQDEAVRDDPSVAEYVRYGRYPYRGRFETESAEDLRQVRGALEELDLADRAHDGLLSLSGGERQRAVLARALAQATPLLLLDEPTSHLDIGHQLDILERVRLLSRRRGTAVLAALHDLNLAARFADRVVILSRGRKYDDGPPRDVLSEELLARVWGVSADLRRDPRSGVPYLLPHHRLVEPAAVRSAPGFGPVHVVGGGGAAAPILRWLVDRGYRATTGALHLLDTDAETAQLLGLPMAVELPFAPLGEEVRAAHRVLLGHAQAIVVAPFAIGPSNLANLTDLEPYAGQVPVYLFNPTPIESRDFASGEGRRGWEKLRSGGAQELGSWAALEAALHGLEAGRRLPSRPSPPAATPT